MADADVSGSRSTIPPLPTWSTEQQQHRTPNRPTPRIYVVAPTSSASSPDRSSGSLRDDPGRDRNRARHPMIFTVGGSWATVRGDVAAQSAPAARAADDLRITAMRFRERADELETAVRAAHEHRPGSGGRRRGFGAAVRTGRGRDRRSVPTAQHRSGSSIGPPGDQTHPTHLGVLLGDGHAREPTGDDADR